MPDINKLSPKDQSRLRGCIAGKNRAWEKEHKQKITDEANKKHFSDCSKELNLE